MILELAFVSLYAVELVISFWGFLSIKRFLKETPRIEDEEALERFKNVARSNMYVALVVIVVLVTGGIIGVLLIFRYGLLGLVGVIFANGVVIGWGMLLSRYEKQARSLSCATEELAREHQRISESWVKKPLPDF